MKKIVSFLAVIVFFVSCEKELAKKPKNLIEKEKMVDVMYDLTLLTAMRNQNLIMMDSFKNNSNDYIYKKYKIDSTQFAQSNIYYAVDSKEYKAMYGQVKLRIEKEKKKIEILVNAEKKKAEKEKVKKKADSIKRVKIQNLKIKKKLSKKEQADSIKKAKSKAEKVKMKRETDSLKKIVAEGKKKQTQVKK